MKSFLKKLAHRLAMIIVFPIAGCAVLEGMWSRHSEWVFRMGGELFSLAPGLPGMYLRRAYYCWTLESCSYTSCVGFGVIFSHRQATVEDAVYIGPYALLGQVVLREGSLIGSRASLISGTRQHARDAQGRWLATEDEDLEQIEIGAGAWLGEGCLVAANVGSGAMISAGAVVANRVPADVMMAGNPARFVKRFPSQEDEQPDEDSENSAAKLPLKAVSKVTDEEFIRD